MKRNPWLIEAEDIRDWTGFVTRLKTPANLVAADLVKQFSKDTGTLLAVHQSGTTPSVPLQNAVIAELQAILRGPCLYDPKRFAGIALTRMTRALIRPAGRKKRHTDNIQVNRLLLAEVFGREVSLGWKAGSREWHKFQVEKFVTEERIYRMYARALQRMLEAACTPLVPLAIVQARAKTVPSFAEKVLRKAEKYDRPVYQITDLCGARIIVNTLDEVELVCKVIRGLFAIDDANTLDTRIQRKSEVFGYRGYHFIIQLKPGKVCEVPVPAAIGDRKAEIQVLTELQHAWSIAGHDRFYKGQFMAPEHLRRGVARVSALLEEADEALLEIIDDFKQYSLHYGVYMDAEQRREEMNLLQIILQNERVRKNKPVIALRLARVAKAACDWAFIVSQLESLTAERCPERAEILAEHGHALCRLHKDGLTDSEYRRGQRELEEAVATGDDRARVQALMYLGWSYGRHSEQEEKARECYRAAFHAEPANPYVLAAYLEFELFPGAGREFLRHMRPAILDAIKTCRAHAAVGIELPWAFFTIGKFYLLLEEEDESFAAYAKAIHLIISGATAFPDDLFDDERRFLRHINANRSLPKCDRCIDDFLLLAQTVRFGGTDLPLKAVRDKWFDKPVVIVAGGAAKMDGLDTYQQCLFEALDGFRGTLISGGTATGVPGMIGLYSAQCKEQNNKGVTTIGYLPELLPHDAPKDTRYDELYMLEGGTNFTAREPLQNWIDLIAAGIKPSEVRVLGINGGRIAALEYRLALALGGQVGVVTASGRAVDELRPDIDWYNAENLLWLPLDRMTVRAFVNPGKTQMNKQQLEKAGKTIHGKFLREKRYDKGGDPAMQPWNRLDETFKMSNRMQAAYAEQVLARHGYAVQASPSPTLIEFKPTEVETMAEMEHGRWVVERLTSGWKYGPNRDPVQKISPYLVPWKDLSMRVQEYDRKVIRSWPKLLAKAGLEITSGKVPVLMR